MSRMFPCVVVALLLLPGWLRTVSAEEAKPDTAAGDALLKKSFAAETARLQQRCLADIRSRKDWQAQRDEYRRQLLEMLGLDPLPERTPLKAQITGTTEHEEFVVERLHFQSRPGLYVTGNLYRPREVKQPLPAILYVCGHGRVKNNGISYGNKAHYQHHGGWFARNGYVCLMIDTLQLGEIEGIHHGTYRYNMWWWPGRGYTPAGVEAWNCVRAIDYLQSREEVDRQRIGVTGRSGGGAYSWWIAAIDERIKAAVPVAGITDLNSHVVDGCVEGHCDCMYLVNTYRWDYPQVAALVAPRPLLISNTDSDGIFPLDGVVRTFEKVRRVYALLGAKDKVALNITAGPHQDTQELRIHAFRWLNKHLKGDDSLIDTTATKLFRPEQLKVFETLPEDQRNTEIHETFVPAADASHMPQSQEAWIQWRGEKLKQLQAKSFRGWPSQPPGLSVKQIFAADRDGVHLAKYEFSSDAHYRLPLYVAHRAGLKQADLVVLNAVDQQGWEEFLATFRPGFAEELKSESPAAADKESFEQTQEMFGSFPWVMAYVPPRGVGPTRFNQNERHRTHVRRRFLLLGQTLDGMQVWDIRRGIAAVREVKTLRDVPLWLQSQRRMAGNSLYASLFEPDIARLDLYNLPPSHREGPFYLNVRRIWDLPQAVAAAAERSRTLLYTQDNADWDYPQQVVQKLGWDKKQLAIREPPGEQEGDKK